MNINTLREREAFGRVQQPFVGVDCVGRLIMEGDIVEVVRIQDWHDERRDRFCAVGKVGKVVSYLWGFQLWVVFKNGTYSGFTDYFLKKKLD